MKALGKVANPIGAIAPKSGAGQWLDPAGAVARKTGKDFLDPAGQMRGAYEPKALLTTPAAAPVDNKKSLL